MLFEVWIYHFGVVLLFMVHFNQFSLFLWQFEERIFFHFGGPKETTNVIYVHTLASAPKRFYAPNGSERKVYCYRKFHYLNIPRVVFFFHRESKEHGHLISIHSQNKLYTFKVNSITYRPYRYLQKIRMLLTGWVDNVCTDQ